MRADIKKFVFHLCWAPERALSQDVSNKHVRRIRCLLGVSHVTASSITNSSAIAGRPRCRVRTDRQTDRRTDRILIARPRLHSMQRGKK